MSVKRMRSEPTEPTEPTHFWVEKTIRHIHELADSRWFDASEEIPTKAFTFTVKHKSEAHLFCFADGSPDVDDAGYDACTGIWDSEFGQGHAHAWVALLHFDYVVTRKEDDGPITIVPHLVSTPLQLATTLLENNILVDNLIDE